MRRSLAWLAIPVMLASTAATAQTYVVDPAGSAVHWLVYRAGAFARFGHNHVISVGQLDGRISVDPQNLERSTFELTVPVMELVVDDPTLRSALGEEFSSVPSADDVAGTRRNMLSDRVLNADQHPVVRVAGRGPLSADGAQELQMTMHLLGRAVEVTVPTTVQIDGDALQAAGEFELTHEQLGLEPFSVMGGALQVGNELTFTYRIRAKRESGSPAAVPR